MPRPERPPPRAKPGASPPRARSVSSFALLAVVWGLVLGWLPGLDAAYPAWIHAEANLAFANLQAPREIEVAAVDPASRADRSDTRMAGGVGSEPQQRFRAVFSLRRRGFWPSAAWIALVAATPLTGRRRIGVAVLGLAILNALLVTQLVWLGNSALAALEGTERTVAPLAVAAFNSPVPSYTVVFVLWSWLARPARGIDLTGLRRIVPPRRS